MAGPVAPYPSWEGATRLAAQVVDGDLVFLSNVVLDQAVLSLTARLSGRRPFGWRTAAAAAVGGAYALATLYPALWPFAGVAGKIAVSILMVAIAFAPVRRPSLVRLLASFYGSAFGLAGLAYGIQGLLATPLGEIGGVLATAIAVPGAWVAAGAVSRTLDARARQGGVLPVRIRVGEREVALVGLIDTGNRARDPLSRMPVVFCERSSLAALFPAELLAAMGGEAMSLFERLPQDLDPDWARRLRLVPIASVAGVGSMVVGFRPDEILVGAAGEVAASAVIGVAPEGLSHDGSFQVLIPAALAPSRQALGEAGAVVPLTKGGVG